VVFVYDGQEAPKDHEQFVGQLAPEEFRTQAIGNGGIGFRDLQSAA
jgi:hypothetical protein